MTWKLLEEHVAFDRDAPISDELRSFLRDGVPVGERLILHDPALAPGENWVQVYERRGEHPRRYLLAHTSASPPMFRCYVPANASTGFTAESPLYEGHWRATLDEHSDLPWPTADAEWAGRPMFLTLLDRVEAAAFRVPYRGFSMCRICGRQNGREGLRFERWEWPAGYRHYLADHDVRPTPEFEAFVTEEGQGSPQRRAVTS